MPVAGKEGGGASARELLKDIAVVDADTHITERYDLWTARAPARIKHRVPQVKQIDGKITWVIDGDKSMGAVCAASAITKAGRKARGPEFLDWMNEDVHAGSYDVRERLAYMDAEGIAAQIAYPNVLGFGGQNAMKVDPELRLVSTQIYNDAMAELQAESGNRIYPMALLPWWDVALAVTETKRCASMGMRGININSDPHLHDIPDLADPYWNKLWDVCCADGLPVNFHIGASDESMSWFGSGLWPGHDGNGKLAYGSLMLFMGNMRVLANILLSGFLERFPELKMVSVESGIGWIDFLLEAVEYQMNEAGMRPRNTPKEVFQRQIYACSWFERRGFAQSVRRLGVDNVLFETDFPHPTCLYPEPIDYMTEALQDMSFVERRKVFGGNATRIYNLDL